MRKALLAFLLVSCFTYTATSQSQCTTCHYGTHDVSDTSLHQAVIPYSLNARALHPNGNASLGLSYIQQNVCGLTYKTSTVEINTRATWQPGSGFPAPLPTMLACFGNNTNVLKAYVYWDASYTEAAPPTTSVTLTNPQGVTGTYSGTLIGQDGPKCWGEVGTACWRADVTPAIYGLGGNFTINNINGFANASWEVDGATLIVIYKDHTATWSGSIAIYDGCWTDPASVITPYTATGFTVCGASTGSAFGIFGDMQNDITPNVNTETFNGSTATFPNNMYNYDSVGTTFTAAQTSCVFDPYTNVTGDCWLWEAAGLYWQNTTCQVCLPSGAVTVTNTIVQPTCGSHNGSITVNATGGTLPYTYLWSPNITTTNSATGLGVGVYVINVNDSTGCNDVKDTILLVNSSAPTLTTSNNPTLCHGAANGSATVVATGGTSPYTYLWSPGGETNATATGLSANIYTVLVTDAAGCQSVALATVSQPAANKPIVNFVDGILCSGQTNGQISVSGGGGTPPYTYHWSTGSTNSSISGLSLGTYSVLITDAHGCTEDTANLAITQPNPLSGGTFFFPTACGQSTGSASAFAFGGTGPYSYSWSNGSSSSFIFNLSAGTYCVTITDANGCSTTAPSCATITQLPPTFTVTTTFTAGSCSGNSSATANMTANTSYTYTYVWSTVPPQTNQTATGLSAGSYTVTVTNNSGCDVSATVTIPNSGGAISCAVNPPSETICIGQSVTLTATGSGGTAPYTYTWDATTTVNPYTASPTVNTVYTVVAKDANGCVSSAVTVPITINPPLTVSIGPASSSSCSTAPVTFTAAPFGGDGNYSYAWSPGGYTSSSITVTPGVNTTYTLVLSDGCNSPAATDSAKITIVPSPVAGFKADTFAGCAPLCVHFTDTSGNNITAWTWNYGDGSPNGTIRDPYYCYTKSGIFSVSLTVTNSDGCSDTKTENNLINPYYVPTVQFSMSPQPTTIQAPAITFMDNTLDPSGINRWKWTFGDDLDSVASTRNTIHTYQDTGTYCVELRVADVHGCSDSLTQCLIIGPQSTLYIPSAFTPNNNGVNDVFMPKGDALHFFEMYIYDRWGTRLFYTNTIQVGWNGTALGQPCSEGTYVYEINILDSSNKKHTYIGDVTLLK